MLNQIYATGYELRIALREYRKINKKNRTIHGFKILLLIAGAAILTTFPGFEFKGWYLGICLPALIIASVEDTIMFTRTVNHRTDAGDGLHITNIAAGIAFVGFLMAITGNYHEVFYVTLSGAGLILWAGMTLVRVHFPQPKPAQVSNK